MEWKTARFDIFMYAFLRSLYRCTLCELLCVRGSDPGEREIKVGTLSAVRRSINRCFQNETNKRQPCWSCPPPDRKSWFRLLCQCYRWERRLVRCTPCAPRAHAFHVRYELSLIIGVVTLETGSFRRKERDRATINYIVLALCLIVSQEEMTVHTLRWKSWRGRGGEEGSKNGKKMK